MKRIVLIYGLISGTIAAALMGITAMRIHSSQNYSGGEVVGYVGILLSFLLVFLGIKAYRDQANEGAFSFGKGFQVGILITLISCVMYVLSWMIIYYNLMPDFLDKMVECNVQQLHDKGATEAEINQKLSELNSYREMYKTPLGVAGLTFLEPFPVGLLVTLISAGILRRKA